MFFTVLLKCDFWVIIYPCFSHFVRVGNVNIARDSRRVKRSRVQNGGFSGPSGGLVVPNVDLLIIDCFVNWQPVGKPRNHGFVISGKPRKNSEKHHFLDPFPRGFTVFSVQNVVQKGSTAVGQRVNPWRIAA